MAYSSDSEIKRELLKIHQAAKLKHLKPRWYEESKSDQKLWNDKGLTFSHDGFEYGSNDFGWYLDKPSMINGMHSKTTPVVAVEGTTGLSRGNTGSAQFARFSHALGASLNGVCGITFQNFQGTYKNRPAYSQYDYVIATIEITKKLKTPNLFIDIDNPNLLIHLLKAYDQNDVNYINKIINECLVTAKKYADTRKPDKDFLIKQDKNNFSEINWLDLYNKKYKKTSTEYIKIMMFNLSAFTTSSGRNAHTVLGEQLANSYLFSDLKGYLLLPRCSKNDLILLKNRHGKELKLLFGHKNINLLAFEDIDFGDSPLKQKIINIKEKKLMGKFSKMKNYLRNELFKFIINKQIKIL